MKIEELKKALLLEESQRIEFKYDCKNSNAIGQVVCGFLNTGGGYLVCGVDDRGRLLGVLDPDATRRNVERALQNNLSPKTLVSVETQEVEGKTFLVIEVPSGKDLPYAFRDVIYLRREQSTYKADIEAIRDMVLRKQIEPERWERRFSSADIELDVDIDEIRSTTADIHRSQRTVFKGDKNIYEILSDLAVAKYGRLTNGGDVLFGKNPAIRLPQVRVRAACFTSDKSGNTFRDMKSFEGPLVPILKQTFDFITRNTPTAAIFSKNKLQRLDESIYPTDAIREALVNAFAHRDYTDSSGGIGVHIYPRRLEIWNSGSLPEGVTPNKMISGHISVLRNPDIAHVLYLRGFMEKLGRGSVLILQECKERGLPQPVWISEEKTGVTLTFFASEVTPEVIQEVTPEVIQEVTPDVLRMLRAFEGDVSRHDLQNLLGMKDDEHFRKAYILPAIRESLIEMTLPEKPRSSKQKYRLTQKGRSLREGTRS